MIYFVGEYEAESVDPAVLAGEDCESSSQSSAKINLNQIIFS